MRAPTGLDLPTCAWPLRLAVASARQQRNWSWPHRMRACPRC